MRLSVWRQSCESPRTVRGLTRNKVIEPVGGRLIEALEEMSVSVQVVDDDPTNKQGFEGAIAYAVASKLGFADSQVKWVRTDYLGDDSRPRWGCSVRLRS
jgi:polar amino acid transport system substrate-binding protein